MGTEQLGTDGEVHQVNNNITTTFESDIEASFEWMRHFIIHVCVWIMYEHVSLYSIGLMLKYFVSYVYLS